MDVISCKVLSPLRHDGQRYELGAVIELPPVAAQRLSQGGTVQILKSAPVQSELTIDPASEIDGVLREADGVVEGELIDGFEDSDQESDQTGKKRGGGKK